MPSASQQIKWDEKPDIDLLAIDTIRTLSMDAVQKAKSGHPGTPMALAPVAYTLWQHALRYDPANPHWLNRDRFVLSVGHASMLLYSLLHLANVRNGRDDEKPVDLEAIRQFRQMTSVTPGHPEYRMTTGVETTTGPLGQGDGNSVGMAMAQRFLAQRYNKPGFPIFDFHVYALTSDGCVMEGVSAEAASLAGHLKLSNLTWIYDSNHITIEGSTDLAFSEDVGMRFKAYGWDVQHLPDANDTAAIAGAIDKAKAVDDRPSLIIVHSIIGYGSPKKAGTKDAHGEALGEDEVKATKKVYGWPEDKQFYVPDGVYQRFAEIMGAKGAKLQAEWTEMFARYREQYPDLAAEIDMIDRQELPAGWDKDIPVFPADEKGVASRESSQKVLNAIARHVPWMIGGAADLAPSTKSNLTFDGAGSFEADNYGGRNLHFGIREHAMGSICNGIALTGMRAYGSGFLIFSDYMKAPIRIGAIMELPVLYIFTHDSIGVGEDGPTHQPIEQLVALRSIPSMVVLRPADANEVAECWKVAMKLTKHPACLIMSRQALPTFDRAKYAAADGVAKGGYILADAKDGKPDVILIATGSEVSLCVKAYETLTAEGIKARVVSLPSWELFEEQDEAYRNKVLPLDVRARVTVEMAATTGWERFAGLDGTIIGMKTFGMSAPGAAVIEKFGFTADRVTQAARDQAKKAKK